MGCGTSSTATVKSNARPDTNHKQQQVATGASTSRQSTHAEVTLPPQTTADPPATQPPQPNEETNQLASSPLLTVVHFNDAYCVDERESEPVGGAARFVAAVKRLSNKKPLVLFSGGVFCPSILSNVTKGRHMVPVLNELDVKAAAIGNHDFDFGLDNLVELIESTNAVWLLSNVTDNQNLISQPLAGCSCVVIDWEGRKVGLMGLADEDWLETMATVEASDVTYSDFVVQAKQTANQLRREGAEIVIALTHMRMSSDTILAEKTQGVIDLVLGGRNHAYETKQVGDILVCKSGTDFREFREVTIDFSSGGKPHIESFRREVTSDIPEDEVVKAALSKYQDALEHQMEEVLDTIEFQLEGRFTKMRKCETNLGNLIADVMKQVTHADVALINSGAVRSDATHGPGEITLKDLLAILPFQNTVTVLEVTGLQLISILENGVSQYPELKGQFPQVSGVKFSFDPLCEPHNRVLKDSILIKNEPLDETKAYKLCTIMYLASGKDGYDILEHAKVLLSEENCPPLPVIIQNHFNSVAIQRGVKHCKRKHKQNPNLHSTSGDAATYFYPKVEGRITAVHKEREVEVSIERDLKNVDGAVEATVTNLETDKAADEAKIGSSEHEKEIVAEHQTGETKDTETQCESDSHVQGSPPSNDAEHKHEGQTASEQDDTLTELKSTARKGPPEQISETQAKQEPCHISPPLKRTTSQLKAVEITEVSSEDEMYALWEAVKSNNIDQVKTLIKEGINPSQLVDTRTVLHLAAEKDLVEVATFLLNICKVKPDIHDEVLQSTPLHIAADGGPEEADFGSAAVAVLLLDKGANINAVDLLGNTPLHLACSTGQDNVKKLLLERNADTTIKNSDGETPAL